MTNDINKAAPEPSIKPLLIYRLALFWRKFIMFFRDYINDYKSYDPLTPNDFQLEYAPDWKPGLVEYFWKFLLKPFVHGIAIPFVMVIGMNGSYALPNLNGNLETKLKNIGIKKRHEKARVYGTEYGMSEAAMLCECDGHRLFLHGNTPLNLKQLNPTLT